MAVYYMFTDENGVDCLDQLDNGDSRNGKWTVAEVAEVAERVAYLYPDTIYFEYPTE